MKDDILKQSPAGKQEAFGVWERIASTTTDLLSLVDRNYIYRAVNDSYLRLHNRSREEVVGHSARELLGPEIFDKSVKDYVDRCLAGEQVRYQSWFNYPTLGRRFMDVSYHPCFDVDGTISGVLADIHDITDLQTTKEALIESEERYKALFEQKLDGVCVIDETMKVLLANQAAAAMFGLDSINEVLEVNPFDFIPPEERERVVSIITKDMLKKDLQQANEFRLINKTGKEVWLNAIGTVIQYQGKPAGLISFRDITQQKRAEEALIQSEERYRTILDEMQDNYFEVDLAGNYTFVNEANARQLGYPKEELMGMNYRTIVASDDVENIYKTFNQVYRTGQPIRAYTFKIVRKNGSTGLGELSVFPLRNDKGEIIGFRGVGRDVTERLQMIEALRQSEERYRTVLEDMEESYYEVDLAGNLTFFNDALCRRLGYSKKELMGMNYRVYTPPENVKKVLETYNRVYRTGEPAKSFPVERIRKDGTRSFSESSVFPLRNEGGEIIGFRGVSRDITERLRMEEALRQSEERYRTVMEEMEEAYYETDLAGNYTFFNNALCQKSGYSREELMGMNYRVYIPPEDVKKVFSAYNQVYRTDKLLKWFPMENIRKDGTRIFVEDSIFPLRNERGDIIGFRGVSRDVTERKQAELERKQMEQRAQFASRLASVGELASGVAHEINNPLTGVIGYAHLLLDRKDISQDIRHDLEIINEGAQRVAAIIRKLLTFARQQKPEQRFANINEIISTTLDLRAYELASNNIRVAFQPARDLPMTIVDPGQLQQMFLNLIINAETEMKLAKGGGKLSIKTKQVDNTIRISFKDNGPGIAKENLERIFDPFFTTREIGQGTGLGLNVCHGIITEHKGKIWVESKLGRGATFIVELPIVTEDSQLVLLEPAVEEPKKVTKAKILVIDDEPVIRQFVSRVLSEEGHEVEAVDDAEDALEKIKSKRYRLILLDIKMPGISGIELYKQFQEIAPSLKKRVVFITGDVIGKRTTDFLAKTKASYMIKPFDAKQLKTEINHILARE